MKWKARKKDQRSKCYNSSGKRFSKKAALFYDRTSKMYESEKRTSFLRKLGFMNVSQDRHQTLKFFNICKSLFYKKLYLLLSVRQLLHICKTC